MLRSPLRQKPQVVRILWLFLKRISRLGQYMTFFLRSSSACSFEVRDVNVVGSVLEIGESEVLQLPYMDLGIISEGQGEDCVHCWIKSIVAAFGESGAKHVYEYI
jgi:hypothetical protein